MKKYLIILASILGMLIVSSPSRAEDDFSRIDNAYRSWFGQESLLDTETIAVNDFVNYKYLGHIALDKIFTDSQSNWKLNQTHNYDPMTGLEVPVGYQDIPLDNFGTKKNLVTNGYFFVEGAGDFAKTRIIIKAFDEWDYYEGSGSFLGMKVTVSYPKGSLDRVRNFVETLKSYRKAKNIYKSRVLEFTPGSNEFRIKFFENLDIGGMKWDDLILDTETKAISKENTDDFLKILPEFNRLGINAKKGVLLSGPPGTGKSFLGKIVINSILSGDLKDKVTFIAVTARHMKYKRSVRNLFDVAADLAPSVIFMEDMDLLGVKDRESYYNEPEKEDLLNEFLNGVDGVVDNDGILTIGTTNRPESVDPALLRGERLGLHIYFGLPKFAERKQFYEKFGRSKAEWTADVSSDWLASESEGMAGAFIVQVIGLAKQQALFENSFSGERLLLTRAHFSYALTTIRDGMDGPANGFIQSGANAKASHKIAAFSNDPFIRSLNQLKAIDLKIAR